jgi:fatty acid desaturase
VTNGSVLGAMAEGSENPSAAGSPEAVERSYRLDLVSYIAPQQLAALAEPSWVDTVGMLSAIWIELLLLLAAANLLSRLTIPWAVAPAILIMVAIATRINALNVVIHEGSHGFLARSRVVNDRLCNAAASWWMLHSVEEYRPSHRLHHLYLHQSRDPDLDQYLIADKGGTLTRLMLRDLIGLTAVRRAQVLRSTANRDANTTRSEGSWTASRNLAGKALAQLIILGQFVVLQGILSGLFFYAIFWLVPVLCIFPVLKRFKAITEHFDPDLRRAGNHSWIARTSAVGRVQDHVIGARMEYHFEHHVLPTIPHRGLKHLHRCLEERGYFTDCSARTRSSILSGGYIHFLSHLSAFGQPGSAPEPIAQAHM